MPHMPNWFIENQQYQPHKLSGDPGLKKYKIIHTLTKTCICQWTKNKRKQFVCRCSMIVGFYNLSSEPIINRWIQTFKICQFRWLVGSRNLGTLVTEIPKHQLLVKKGLSVGKQQWDGRHARLTFAHNKKHQYAIYANLTASLQTTSLQRRWGW